jgi:hypothetical protein
MSIDPSEEHNDGLSIEDADQLNIENAIRAERAKERPLKLRKKSQGRPKPPVSTIEQILAWADSHYTRTGAWPTQKSGRVYEERSLSWCAINARLTHGHGPLPGRSSLAQLLADERGRRHHLMATKLTIEQIAQWADAHRKLTGAWPRHDSGPVHAAPDENWSAIDQALRNGIRGLPGKSSLAQLLAAERGVRNTKRLPDFTIDQILEWAVSYYDRHECYPRRSSGAIPESPGDTWMTVGSALEAGHRGLPGGSSLEILLASEFDARRHRHPPNLTLTSILAWADAHQVITGKLPRTTSGAILPAPGETWAAIDLALRRGTRGLPGGSSLARLLTEERSVRNEKDLPALNETQIEAWARAHFERTGRYPVSTSGPIADTLETWGGINAALVRGSRSLQGSTTLARFLREKCGVHRGKQRPDLTTEQILEWAELHTKQHGRAPTGSSGNVGAAPGETWSGIDYSLRYGRRGLEGGTTLANLLSASTRGKSEP